MKSLLTTIIACCTFTLTCSAQWTPGTGIITTANKVGIGTSNPIFALQIGDFPSGLPSSQIVIPGNYNFEQLRWGQIGNGNSALEFVNHQNVTNSAGIKFLVDVDHGAPGLQLQYAPSAASYAALNYTTGLYMNFSGNIGIGTTSPDQKLTINGQVHATSVVVTSTVPADYVFNTDYYLRPLASVKAFIDHHHHLPDVPSAANFHKDGQNLGEMNMLLLRKVEELTRYMIEKDKQIIDQKEINSEMKDQLATLTKEVELLKKVINK